MSHFGIIETLKLDGAGRASLSETFKRHVEPKVAVRDVSGGRE